VNKPSSLLTWVTVVESTVGDVHDLARGDIDTDPSQQPTGREGHHPTTPDSAKEHGLRQRTVLVPDQTAGDSRLKELPCDVRGHLGRGFDVAHGELRPGQLRKRLDHRTFVNDLKADNISLL
jgi:hypothetical protein